jgi:LacI family transcriptional regulator
MRDVASTAGVSVKTVSRVVNGERGVKPDTAARVDAAILRLGFARNDLARSLRRGRAGALGLIIEDVANPFYSAIARAVEDAAHERGHILITGSCEEDAERERQLVLRLLRRAVDALLIVPAGGDHRYLRPELGAGTPVVFLDRPPVGVEADTVLLDNVGGARLGVEHLARRGHEGIAFVGDPPALYTARERLAGYRAALAEAGLAVPEELVRAGSHDAGSAQEATRALLALPAARRPTAIFCANNRNTIGALRALRDAARPVALVGFDDFELADMLATPVTVVRHAPEEMGRLGAELAYARLDGDRGVPARRVIACELVERGSGEVAPPRPRAARGGLGRDRGGEPAEAAAPAAAEGGRAA